MKKKGFTLIELLAVIVILAVIALIATPMILNLIEKTKMSAAIESVNGIIDSAEKNTVTDLIDGIRISYYDLTANTLEYKGKKPEKGELFIDDKGNTKVIAEINNYCVTKGYGDIEPYIVDATNCELYKEEILNGTDPILKGGLIPVTIADNGEVTYANITKKWYSYTDKEWANAVILVDNPSKTYSVGDIILEDDIESYFVWIPKYSYKLWDLGKYDDLTQFDTSKVHAIDIRFGLENTNDTNSNECTTPLVSGASGNCEVDDYMTHPAFITMNATGLWVGKFETTGDATQLTVKPNSSSFGNKTVGKLFELGYNYNRELDSHMMKNTEWGAVAYLHHSKYGSSKELMINNSSNTGYASVKAPTCGWTGDNRECNKYGTTSDITLPYNTETGYKASTTGNMSGIYDMAGGKGEYVASYRDNTVGKSELIIEFIKNNSKYFDIYSENSDLTTFNNRILGDATGEMGPFAYQYRLDTSWYSDTANFAQSNMPWFYRGGVKDNGVGAGAFSFCRQTGEAFSWISFRLVLAP